MVVVIGNTDGVGWIIVSCLERIVPPVVGYLRRYPVGAKDRPPPGSRLRIVIVDIIALIGIGHLAPIAIIRRRQKAVVVVVMVIAVVIKGVRR